MCRCLEPWAGCQMYADMTLRGNAGWSIFCILKFGIWDDQLVNRHNANILKSEKKNLKSETPVVTSIVDKEY